MSDLCICHWQQHDQTHGFAVFQLHNARYPHHTHADYQEFLVVDRGTCRHRLNGEMRLLQEREVLFLRKQDRHELLGDDCMLVNLPFVDDWLVRITDLLQAPGLWQGLLTAPEPPLFRVDETDWPRFRQQVETLLQHTVDLEGRMLFSRFLLDCIRLLQPPSAVDPEAGPPWLSKLLAKVEALDSSSLAVSTLVHLSGYSHEHLARSFRRHLGCSPSGFLNRIRLRRAARLLTQTNQPVSRIVRQVGLDDPAYFCRLFRAEFGESPRAYRSRKPGLRQFLGAG